MDNKTQYQLSKKIESFPTFSEILAYRAEQSSAKTFLVEGDNRWTYREFDNLVNRCCRYFAKIGLKPGNTVSFILRNSIDYLIIYFAAIRSRIILNPFPHHMSGDEVLKKLEDIHPESVFCHKNHYNTLTESNYRIINLDNMNSDCFTEYLQNFVPDSLDALPADENDVAVYYYSSGTTGGPKIIEYTHSSMVLTQASMLRAGFTEPGAVHLCVLPLGHTASLRYTIKQCVCTGSTVVLYDSFWKLRSNLWHEVQKHRATFMEIVPSILIAILNTPYKDFSKEQVGSMRFIGCGSAFLPQNLHGAFEEKFNIPVANLYGLSETGATHFDDPFVKGRVIGSIGKPFDIVEARIFGENRREVHNNEVGEIGIKGPGLLKGYFNNSKLFDECFHKGYFMTGDLCRKDKFGNYYYVDRKKDLIIKGGVNIVPSQIEEVLQSHPVVREAAVIGKPDMLLGETIKCYLVSKNGSKPDIKELKSYCKEKLGDFKTPTEFEVVESLPKGPSGKILKRALRSSWVA